jgi:hypothetical protein
MQLLTKKPILPLLLSPPRNTIQLLFKILGLPHTPKNQPKKKRTPLKRRRKRMLLLKRKRKRMLLLLEVAEIESTIDQLLEVDHPITLFKIHTFKIKSRLS